jgi:hypothetical protein
MLQEIYIFIIALLFFILLGGKWSRRRTPLPPHTKKWFKDVGAPSYRRILNKRPIPPRQPKPHNQKATVVNDIKVIAMRYFHTENSLGRPQGGQNCFTEEQAKVIETNSPELAESRRRWYRQHQREIYNIFGSEILLGLPRCQSHALAPTKTTKVTKTKQRDTPRMNLPPSSEDGIPDEFKNDPNFVAWFHSPPCTFPTPKMGLRNGRIEEVD